MALGSQPSPPAIVCSNLYSPVLPSLKRPALNGVNCVIQAGEFVTLLGLNGAGKSTLLRSLVGLVPIQKGSIQINGVLVDSKRLRHSPEVSILFQGGGLVPQLTALENVLCGRLGQRSTWQTLMGFCRQDRRDAIHYLQELGLEDQVNQKTSQLSGGQRQRVAIARMMMQSPKILLVDEPTSGLDTLAAKQVMEIFSKLNQQGILVIAVLHEWKIAAKYAQRAIVLEDGRVSYDGSCNRLTRQFSTENQ
jgi:phosphonate transport system ATP-binding protein